MKIFASWSGQYSKRVAELLRDWVPNVIQEATVYVSSQDIAKGEAWPDSVRGNLSEIDLGIVVVTKSNFEAPWILFEAGALSKSVKSRMIPLLCNVDHVDLAKSPLRLFQSSMVNTADVLAMMQSLNSFAENPLSEERLATAFQKWWPDFEQSFAALEPETEPKRPAKAAEDSVVVDALEALLADVQTIKAQLRNSSDAAVQYRAIKERDAVYDNYLRNALSKEDVATRATEVVLKRDGARRILRSRPLPRGSVDTTGKKDD